MTLTIIGFCIIASLLLGIIAVSSIRLRKLRQTQQSLEERIEMIRYEENEREKDLNVVKDLIQENKHQVELLSNQKRDLEERKSELNKDIAAQVDNIERLKSSYTTAEEEFKKKYMNERTTWLKDRQEEYIKMQADFVEQFREQNKVKMTAAQELTEKLHELQSAADAAIEVAKRHAEEENFTRFHSLQMSSGALADVKKLEDIVPSVSKEAGEAIAKVIWKVYYEKPLSDLLGRVIGDKTRTGIYRITNTITQMCYVGQAVDIGDRWRQHIKRALNAEPRTQNKLYPAMYEAGIENWTFEIIEECTRDKLNEREDYWQDFYKAKEYGYSIK